MMEEDVTSNSRAEILEAAQPYVVVRVVAASFAFWSEREVRTTWFDVSVEEARRRAVTRPRPWFAPRWRE